MADRSELVLVNVIHAKTGGGKVYLDQVLPRLAAMPGSVRYLAVVRPDQEASLRERGVATLAVRAPEGPLGSLLWDQTMLPWIAVRRGAALVFTPANFGPWILGHRSLVLLRNTPQAASPGTGWFLRLYWLALREVTRLSVLSAGGGLVVSGSFRDHLASAFGLDPRGLQVVHHGVDSMFRPDGPAAPVSGSGPFLLVVSDLYPHKNLLVLVDAFAIVARGRPDLRLLVAGREWDPSYSRKVRERIAHHGLAGRVEFLGGVPQQELPPLYRAAAAAVCVSTAETFGISQVEAMACGTPLVVSDLPYAHEIAADAALFVPPHDAAGMAGGLTRVLEDAGAAADLRARGLQRARHFTWDATARAVHAAIVRRVAGLA